MLKVDYQKKKNLIEWNVTLPNSQMIIISTVLHVRMIKKTSPFKNRNKLFSPSGNYLHEPMATTGC